MNDLTAHALRHSFHESKLRQPYRFRECYEIVSRLQNDGLLLVRSCRRLRRDLYYCASNVCVGSETAFQASESFVESTKQEKPAACSVLVNVVVALKEWMRGTML